MYGQIDKSLKISTRGVNTEDTSLGSVRKGHFAQHGFITPNSLGSAMIDNDRIRLLNSFDIAFLNEKTELDRFTPTHKEANKMLIPLGMLQAEQSKFPFIAPIPNNFIRTNQLNEQQEENQKQMLDRTEKIVERIEELKRQKIKFV
tara:strand:- start:1158 stop:1595 length:438 start_codon:yes stop_codon:yes gene_type:complete